MGFLPSFLAEIRRRVPISTVVGKKVKLIAAGAEFKGLSPFIDEKTPSFVVNDNKGFFHDFSTGKHGDIFDFFVEIDGVSHSTAVQQLAQIAGFSISEIDQQKLPENLSSSSDVRRWLQTQSHESSAVYSVRSALRAVPFLVSLSDSENKKIGGIEPLILLSFRAVAAAWVIARYPPRKNSLIKSARAAHQDLMKASQQWSFKSPANVAVGRASAAAARAAMNSITSASNAALDIEEAFIGAVSEPNIFSNFELEGVLADIATLEGGSGTRDLIHMPLWLQGIPYGIQNEWDELEAGLLALNKDWFVWADWYKARLKGHFSIETIEVNRTKIGSKIWKQSPEIVNAKIIEIVSGEEDRSSNSLVPLENVPSPFAFQVSEGKISLVASPSNSPQFPFSNSKREQVDRLNACRTLAHDLISDLKAKKFQARSEYMEGFEKYAERLPSAVAEGNFLLAEAEARTLRNLFAAEAQILSVAFAAKLKTFLEQHIGLRVFYPDVANFYRDVKSGRIIEPLPLDAIEGVLNGVRENTPVVFEATVQHAIGGSLESKSISLIADTHVVGADSNPPLPPIDPLGEIEPRKASDFTFAGATNGIWKAFLQGEKIHKALEGWSKTRQALAPHVGEILGWLHRFMASSNGSPPPGG